MPEQVFGREVNGQLIRLGNWHFRQVPAEPLVPVFIKKVYFVRAELVNYFLRDDNLGVKINHAQQLNGAGLLSA